IKRLLKAIALPLLLLSGIVSFAQEQVVSGKVTDSKTGAGISDASITVKGTKKGISSGIDGSYKISVPSGATTLVISSTGFTASNDPLIVIDGLPVEGNDIKDAKNLLNTINPNDIESISILKDASATALYGSRASNGIIIITTKKGAAGKSKLRFNFNSQIS